MSQLDTKIGSKRSRRERNSDKKWDEKRNIPLIQRVLHFELVLKRRRRNTLKDYENDMAFVG
jgi:hypothetical protein